jgi:hypothetical protein
MIVVFEAAAATHGDEPRIPDRGENHQFALASAIAEDIGIDIGHTIARSQVVTGPPIRLNWVR